MKLDKGSGKKDKQEKNSEVEMHPVNEKELNKILEQKSNLVLNE